MISTRKAVEADFEFTLCAKEAGYRRHIEAIWGKWDAAWQRAEHKKDFDTGLLEIITYNGLDAGYLYVRRTGKAINLPDITILPEYQGKGIGTYLIKVILAEARSKNIPVELGAFKINLSAIKLYKSLGFKQVSETTTHVLMCSL